MATTDLVVPSSMQTETSIALCKVIKAVQKCSLEWARRSGGVQLSQVVLPPIDQNLRKGKRGSPMLILPTSIHWALAISWAASGTSPTIWAQGTEAEGRPPTSSNGVRNKRHLDESCRETYTKSPSPDGNQAQRTETPWPNSNSGIWISIGSRFASFIYNRVNSMIPSPPRYRLRTLRIAQSTRLCHTSGAIQTCAGTSGWTAATNQ